MDLFVHSVLVCNGAVRSLTGGGSKKKKKKNDLPRWEEARRMAHLCTTASGVTNLPQGNLSLERKTVN